MSGVLAVVYEEISAISLLFLGLELGHLRAYIVVLCLFLGPGAGPAYVEISAIVLYCFSAWSWASIQVYCCSLLFLGPGAGPAYVEISAIVLCCFSAWSWATYEYILLFSACFLGLELGLPTWRYPLLFSAVSLPGAGPPTRIYLLFFYYCSLARRPYT